MTDTPAKCIQCDDQGWVCESHPEQPWEGMSSAPNACACGGAGEPCHICYPRSIDGGSVL